jgi:hypothetical protein
MYNNYFMNTYPIPVRFTTEEEYVLRLGAKKFNLPLSTYIKNIVKKEIESEVAKVNKTQILLAKIKKTNLNKESMEESFNSGAKMRKDFNLGFTK